MQKLLFTLRYLLAIFLLACPAMAEEITIGNDTYASGSSATLSNPTPRDIFAAGFNVNIKARAEKDVHVAGFNVSLDGPIGGNAYAAGYSIDVTAPIAGDLTAMGSSVTVSHNAAVTGNARFAAKSLVLDAPVAGSVIAGAGDMKINDVISGDAVLTFATVNFGSNARINGKLKYYSTEPVTIPESVIPADHVQFEKVAARNARDAVGETASRSLPDFWPSYVSMIAGFVFAIAFLVAMAAVLLAFAPVWMDERKNEALHAPVKTMALGLLGLSLAIGLVPVSGMTLIGIPLIPFALLAIMVLWILGFIVGAYAIAVRLSPATSNGSPSLAAKLVALGACFVVLSLLHYIPVIGWLCNLAVLFLGLGTIMMQMARYITREMPQSAPSLAK